MFTRYSHNFSSRLATCALFCHNNMRYRFLHEFSAIKHPQTMVFDPPKGKIQHGSSTEVLLQDSPKEIWHPVINKKTKNQTNDLKASMSKLMSSINAPGGHIAKQMIPSHPGLYQALNVAKTHGKLTPNDRPKTKKIMTAKAIEPEFIHKTKDKKNKLRKLLTKTRKLLTKDAKADNIELMTRRKRKLKMNSI